MKKKLVFLFRPRNTSKFISEMEGQSLPLGTKYHAIYYACILLFLFILFSCKTSKKEITIKAESIAEYYENLHGITLSADGTIYFASNGNKVYKLVPGGKRELLTIIKEGKGYYSTGRDCFIYDIALDTNRLLYAASEDRVIKIYPNGRYESIIFLEDSDSEYGIVSIFLDDKNEIYICNQTKIYHYDINLKKNILLDSKELPVETSDLIGFCFDSDYKNLYVSDRENQRLLVISYYNQEKLIINKTSIINLDFSPEYIRFYNKYMLVGGPTVNYIVKIKGKKVIQKINFEGLKPSGYRIETFCLDIKDPSNPVLFGTAWSSGTLYKIPLIKD